MKFIEIYEEELKKAIVAYPDQYHYPVEEAPYVVARMSAAIERGTFNKDGAAFKATCKRLGIKHTYQAINDFIKKQEAAS